MLASKKENFNRFKAIAGITFVMAIIIAFINIISAENATL
jgi:preprotein translocase subunit SecE